MRLLINCVDIPQNVRNILQIPTKWIKAFNKEYRALARTNIQIQASCASCTVYRAKCTVAMIMRWWWTPDIDDERIAVIDIANICQHSSAVAPWPLARSKCVGLILLRKINGYLTFSPSFPRISMAPVIYSTLRWRYLCMCVWGCVRSPFPPPSNFFNEARASQDGGEFSGSCP